MQRQKPFYLLASLTVLFMLLRLSLIDITPVLTVYTAMVDPTIRYQIVDGWGTSLAWWANIIGGWPQPNRSEIADLIFDPTKGLGLNVVRYNIGAGDGPDCPSMRPGAQMPLFEPADGQWDWTVDANQRWMLEAAQSRGANLFEAFSNSPPYWMTNSGCSSGDPGGTNNLAISYSDKYADYLTEVVKHYHDVWGITFRTVEPFNEANSSFSWPSNDCLMGVSPGCQEGANFSQNMQNIIVQEVGASLVSKGLTATTVSAPDENSIDATINSFNSYDSTTQSYISQINTHSYNRTRREDLWTLAQISGKRLWMSEFGTGGSTDPNDIGSALKLSGQILLDMKEMHPTAWVYWQAVENSDNSTWGLMRASFSDSNPTSQTYTLTKQYYTMANYSKFIRPGYQMIGINDTNSLAAFDPSSGTLIIVTTNNTAIDNSVTYNLLRFSGVSGTVKVYRTSCTEDLARLSDILLSGNGFTAVAQANSITTYIVSGVSKS